MKGVGSCNMFLSDRVQLGLGKDNSCRERTVKVVDEARLLFIMQVYKEKYAVKGH